MSIAEEPWPFIVIVAKDVLQFESEVNHAIARGYSTAGELHYHTHIDETAGRIEQWSIAMLRDAPLTEYDRKSILEPPRPLAPERTRL